MTDKFKKVLSHGWVVYLLLALSYCFKGAYAYSAMANYMASAMASESLVTLSGSAMTVVSYLTMCLSETLSAVVAAHAMQFVLERSGRAFMVRRNFVLAVSLYTIVANVILGIVGLTYFISPLIYVFVPKIASLIVYTAVYGFMFYRMYKTSVIPEYMVARAFMTMAIPYFAVTAIMMF